MSARYRLRVHKVRRLCMRVMLNAVGRRQACAAGTRACPAGGRGYSITYPDLGLPVYQLETHEKRQSRVRAFTNLGLP